MAWPCVAVNAAVLAAAIGIDRLRERNVRRIVARDNAFRVFDGDVRLERLLAAFVMPAVVECFACGMLKAAFGIDAGAAAFARRGTFVIECFKQHSTTLRRDSARSNAKAWEAGRLQWFPRSPVRKLPPETAHCKRARCYRLRQYGSHRSTVHPACRPARGYRRRRAQDGTHEFPV